MLLYLIVLAGITYSFVYINNMFVDVEF